MCKDQPRKPLHYPLYWRITLLFHTNHVQTLSGYNKHSNRTEWISHLTDAHTKPEQVAYFDARRWGLKTTWNRLRNHAASHTNKTDNIACNIQHTRRTDARKLISFTGGLANDVFALINRTQQHQILSQRTRSLALALLKQKLTEDTISHYFHTLHQLNQTALYRLYPFETLLGLLWIAVFCFQCLKRLCWFLSLCQAYYPQQNKQWGCSNVIFNTTNEESSYS